MNPISPSMSGPSGGGARGLQGGDHECGYLVEAIRAYSERYDMSVCLTVTICSLRGRSLEDPVLYNDCGGLLIKQHGFGPP